MQELKNEKFNEMLDNLADKLIAWQFMEQKKTLRGIKKYSFKFFDSPMVSLKEGTKEV